MIGNPLLVVTAAASIVLLLSLLLRQSPRAYTLLCAAYVVFLPKLGLLAIPGTTVALRGEDLMLGLLLVRIIGDLVIHGRTRPLLPSAAWRITGWLLALLPIGLVSTIFAVRHGTVASPMVALLFLARRYEYFVMFLAGCLYFRGADGQRQVLTLIRASAFVNLTVALSQRWGIVGGFRAGEYHTDVSDRVTGMFAGPYELAAYTSVIVTLFLWQTLHGKQRLAGALGIAACLLTVWMTQSRVAIVAMLAVGMLMVLTLSRRRAPLALGMTWAAAATAAVFSRGIRLPTGRFGSLDLTEMARATANAYRHRDFRNIGSFRLMSTISDTSYAMRIDRWFNYYDGLVQYNPLLGLGPSAGGEAVDGNYLRILFEFGILGLVVALGLLITLVRVIHQLARGPFQCIAAWGGLALMMQAIFIDVFEASKVIEPYWLILGVAITAGTRAADLPPADIRPDII